LVFVVLHRPHEYTPELQKKSEARSRKPANGYRCFCVLPDVQLASPSPILVVADG
jgi:hypothetical protein